MAPFSSLSLDSWRRLLRCFNDLLLFGSIMAICVVAVEGGSVSSRGTSQVPLVLVWHDPYGLLPCSFDPLFPRRGLFVQYYARLSKIAGNSSLTIRLHPIP